MNYLKTYEGFFKNLFKKYEFELIPEFPESLPGYYEKYVGPDISGVYDFIKKNPIIDLSYHEINIAKKYLLNISVNNAIPYSISVNRQTGWEKIKVITYIWFDREKYPIYTKSSCNMEISKREDGYYLAKLNWRHNVKNSWIPTSVLANNVIFYIIDERDGLEKFLQELNKYSIRKDSNQKITISN